MSNRHNQQKENTNSSQIQPNSPSADKQEDKPIVHQKSVKKFRWIRFILKAFLCFVIFIVFILAAFWVWAGREGSLSQAISLAQRFVPLVEQSLTIEDVQGSIRHGGKIRFAHWQQDSVDAQITDLDVNWNLNNLIFHRELFIAHVTADQVQIQTFPSEVPSNEVKTASTPPQDLRLPFKARLDLLQVGTVIYGDEKTGLRITDIKASYVFDSSVHHLTLENLDFEQGTYQAQATMTGINPTLDAVLNGSLVSNIPGSLQSVHVNANVFVKGPLTQLLVDAKAQAQTFAATDDLQNEPDENLTREQSDGATSLQTASMTATIMPWAALIVPQAQLDLNNFNTGAIWHQSPQTLLSGQVHITSHESTASPIGRLQINAYIQNLTPGAIDQDRLPVTELNTDMSWDQKSLLLNSLEILLGDQGYITTTGHITPSLDLGKILPFIQLQTTVHDVNPRNIHSAISNDLVNGQITLSLQDQELRYNIALKALENSLDRNMPYKLQEFISTGSLINQILTLENVHITSSRSDLTAKVTYTLPISVLTAIDEGKEIDIAHAFEQGIATGTLHLNMPGIATNIDVKQLSASSGSLAIDLQATNTQETLSWLQHMPFAPSVLLDYMVRGTLNLQGKIDGGWRDPLMDIKLDSDALFISQKQQPITPVQVNPQSNSASQVSPPQQDHNKPETQNTFVELVNIKDTHLAVRGRLNELTVELKTLAIASSYQIGLDSKANGGWRNDMINVEFNQFDASLSENRMTTDTAFSGKPIINIKATSPVHLQWNIQNSALVVNPGSLSLQIAGKEDNAPSLHWGKTTWQSGTLDSSGSLDAFPILWLTSLMNADLLDEHKLSGDLMIAGQWKIHIGSKLDFSIEINRTSGDLTLEESSTNAFASVNASEHFHAGVRDAYIKIYNKDNQVFVELAWDTERIGIINIDLNSTLTRQDNFWTLRPDAPIRGNIIAQLPEIDVATMITPTGWRLGGAAILETQVEGTIARPALNGRLTAAGISLRSVIDGIAFTDGEMEIIFDRDKVLLQRFSVRGAEPDGGLLTATGVADWSRGALPEIELNLVMDKLKVSVHNNRQLTASGKFSLSFKNKALDILGNLYIDRALIILDNASGPELDDDVVILTGKEELNNAPVKMSEQNPLDGLDIVPNIQIQIDLGKNFRIQGFGLQTYLIGDLVLSNQRWTPTLIGTVHTENGRFKAYGQHLIVEHGNIIFSGQIDNPTLDLLAIRANTRERVGVNITGTASHPSIQLYSEAGLSDTETLSWLVLGRPASADGTEMAILQQAALALLSGDEEGLTDRVAGMLGLDDISIGGSNSRASSNSSDDTLANTTITISKRLSDNFYVSYEQGLTGGMGTFYLFYEISRRLTLRMEAGEFTAVDLFYSFKFDGKEH